MIFGGNPGSSKTTVAKLFSGIAKEEGILKSGVFVERGGMDLDGLGCVYEIREAFMAAKGGVLFIDEAYSLRSDTAVTVLIQEMENHRDEVIVILAGYNEKMKEFMKRNEGLKSRIPYWIDFPDYNADELTDILKVMAEDRGFKIEDDALKEAHYIFEKASNIENFGNGRYVRNLIEHALQKQSVRLLGVRESAEKIRKKELFTITRDDICMLEEMSKHDKTVGAAKQELQEMIGLTSTKSIMEKALASFKLRKICLDRGIAKDKASLHMVFTGNPGTAKTTVARLFAEILKDEQVLSTGTFVEVGRADLVGSVVGSTAPLVKKKFKEAQGGVLFIDEAYSLCDEYENGFGDEAINTIVQEMENHRDNVIVIFAGYPDKMKHFLDRNPGLMSRIAFHVDFEDYSTDELCAISDLLIERKSLKITEQAKEKLRMLYDQAKGSNDFGNGRFVRKTIEEAEMNLAERLMRLGESKITEELLTVIEVEDIPDFSSKQKQEAKRIGFCA
jgi:replication-associated recombination protein RarA